MHNFAKSARCLHIIALFIIIQTSLFIDLCVADKELNCLVCRAVIDELEFELKKANPKRTVDTGGFRIESDGSQKKTKKQYAYSEMHLHDVLDDFCSRMEHYAQAKYKDSGRRTIVRLVGNDGKMNDKIGDVDFIPDDKLNTNLKYLCEALIDEYEDDIVNIYIKKQKDADLRLCAQATGYCPGSLEDNEEYEFEKEEL